LFQLGKQYFPSGTNFIFPEVGALVILC